ncbi:MAG TPA: SRPBCC family protein [Gemmatimonadaceae bacterium]|nr:SRPBCC family protein [Gemmatimonadaceae bacterium]
MALEFKASEWIAASPNVAYGVATNRDLAGKWLPNFVRMDKITRGEFGPGTRFRETRKMFGKTVTEVFEVVSADRPNRVALFVDGTQGSAKHGRFDYVYEFTEEGDGTRVVLSGQVTEVPWLWALLGRVFMGGMRRACATDLRAMKVYIESQSTILRHSTATMETFKPRDIAKGSSAR